MREEQLKELLPKDTFDISTISKLMELPENELKILLPDLIPFFYDSNWQVTQELPPIMLKFPEHLLPLLIQVLREDEPDDMYKYFVVVDLVRAMPLEYRKTLTTALNRLVENPTKGEKYEEVDIQAKEVLEQWEEEIKKE